MFSYYYTYGYSGILYLLLFVVIIFTMYAQFKVNSSYKKYSKIANSRGITGREMAERILLENDIHNVSVTCIAGTLTDHYNPQTRQLCLSRDVYNGTSIAAIGVAAHEAGHAVQHSVQYFPIKLRSTLVPVANIGNSLAIPVALLGFIFTGATLFIDIGIVLYLAVFLFHLVTVPVEVDASARAIRAIPTFQMTTQDVKGAKRVLSAAAMTYLASMLSSLLQLLRLLNMRGRRN